MTDIESWSDLLQARSGQEVIAFLREHPELVNRPDIASSEYALEQAVFYEQRELVTALLDLGADPDQLNDQGRLALHTAIELFEDSPEAALQLAALLVSRGADIEARGFPDFTALHRACAVDAMPIALLLIEHGANLNAAAEAWIDGGRTPLDVAETHAHEALAAALRNKGGRSAGQPWM
ncbi:ankyrin repeat domain-containing protein [Uliginosibacterium sp. H1]|uniref:ankyrin repeat domain-containing protein n=1 Tax=Uliginosibacterium sp. H1 TaxID=3114757 RepID=UPI002E170C58|nr:ankyrin repeat domain-containing protein [Uliginosibacterium sp. H1]